MTNTAIVMKCVLLFALLLMALKLIALMVSYALLMGNAQKVAYPVIVPKEIVQMVKYVSPTACAMTVRLLLSVITFEG